MINLLARLAAARTEQTAVVGDRSDHLLEWPRIKDQLAAHCRNERAAEIIRRSRPFSSTERISSSETIVTSNSQNSDPSGTNCLW